MKIRTFAPALTLAAALSLAACSGGGNDEGTEAPEGPDEGTSEEMTDSPAEDPSEEMDEEAGGEMGAQFGPACADVPATGDGSFEGMAQDPVATAASNTPHSPPSWRWSGSLSSATP